MRGRIDKAAVEAHGLAARLVQLLDVARRRGRAWAVSGAAGPGQREAESAVEGESVGEGGALDEGGEARLVSSSSAWKLLWWPSVRVARDDAFQVR